MHSNTHSITSPGGLAALAAELTALAAELTALAAQDPAGLTDGAQVERTLVLRRMVDQMEGHWLQELAVVDARGAAGAEDGVQAASTASWLRSRLRLSAGAATSAVRTARALFRGPLPATGQAVIEGAISPAHAAVLAAGTQELPAQVTAEAEPVLLEAARRLDPSRLRRVLGHLRQVADPDREQDRVERRHQQRGVWLTPTWEGMVALNGWLEPEAGQTLIAALEPLARPTTADDTRTGGQRTADALTELARRQLEGGRLPQTGGVRPQLLVTVDLDSLLGRPGAVGGDLGGFGPLDPEACRRLACDASVTRVVVSRQPGHHLQPNPNHRPSADAYPVGEEPSGLAGLAGRLQAAMVLLPPILGGAPSQPLEVGRATRVVSPAQRAALIVRDGGCVVPDCDRPPPWCDAHHLVHWLDGGPTDLPNLALLCRAHHRAVHEGGWRLIRDPDGGLIASPPHRRPRPAA
jgi:hypothetical protein